MYRVLLSLKNDVKGSTNELAMNIACGDINAANRGKMHTHTRPNIRRVPKHVWPGYYIWLRELYAMYHCNVNIFLLLNFDLHYNKGVTEHKSSSKKVRIEQLDNWFPNNQSSLLLLNTRAASLIL